MPALRSRIILSLGAACLLSACPFGRDDAVDEPAEIVTEYQPRVAFTAQGNAVVAYQGSASHKVVLPDATVATIELYHQGLRHYSADARLVHETISNRGSYDDPDGSRTPHGTHALAGDASGTALAIHTSGVVREAGFKACRSTAAAPDWVCSALLLTSDEREVEVALNGAGAAVALLGLWDASTNGTQSSAWRRELYSVMRPAGGDWSVPRKIADSLAGHTRTGDVDDRVSINDPALVAAADGNAYALYVDSDNNLVGRRYRGATDTWEAPAPFAAISKAAPVSHARLVLHRAAPEAAAMALWLAPANTPPAAPRLQALRFVGDRWVATAPLPAHDCGRKLDAAMSADGDVMAAWLCGGSVYASRFSGGAWSAPQWIGSGAPPDSPIHVASDAAGNAVALWTDATQVVTASFTRATGWRPAYRIGKYAVDWVVDDDVALAMDDNGQALAVWPRFFDERRPDFGTRLVVQSVGPLAELRLTTPEFVFGGDSFELAIALVAPASADLSIALSSDFTPGALTLPATATVLAGQREVRIAVPSGAVPELRSGRITASYGDRAGSTALTLLPEPVLALSIAPALVTAGQNAQLRVSLDRAYPVALSVELTSDNPAATLVSPLTIAAGETIAQALVATPASALAAQTAVLSARLRNSRASTVLQVDAGLASLTIQVVGGGQVTLAAPAVGIACPGDCTEAFAPGTEVGLIQSANAGSSFVGWSGDADCSDGVVRLDAARHCTATFAAVGSGHWSWVGNALGGGLSTRTVSVVVDRSNPLSPVIFAASTVEQALGRIDLIVQRFDNPNWTLLGTGAINADAVVTTRVFTPALAVVGGMPVVAWPENEQRIRVKRWNGNAWVSLAENLNVDPAASVFGTQLTTAGSELVVAWLERDAAGLTTRMALKRYDPVALSWTGALVLPAETNVQAVRVSTEAAGNTLLMFVPFAPTVTQEGPLRVLRDAGGGNWLDVCPALSPPAGSRVVLYPNSVLGFGVTRSAVTGETVALATNGLAVFVQACRGGAWVGLDGSAQGQVAQASGGGELGRLGFAQGQGSGVALAWSEIGFFAGTGNGYTVRLLVENNTATAMVPTGSDLFIGSDVTLLLRSLSFGGFAAPGSPVLATLSKEDFRGHWPRVFRWGP